MLPDPFRDGLIQSSCTGHRLDPRFLHPVQRTDVLFRDLFFIIQKGAVQIEGDQQIFTHRIVPFSVVAPLY